MNAALLEIIIYAYPERRLTFYAEETHINEVSQRIGSDFRKHIDWKPVDIPPRRAETRTRFPGELMLLSSIFRRIRQESVGHLVLTNALASTLLALKSLRLWLARNVKIQVFMHGQLSEVAGWRSRNPFVRSLDLKSAMYYVRSDNLQYVVLENVIKNELLRVSPELKGSVVALSHPLLQMEGEQATINDSYSPIKIAFLGLATQEKGFPIFLRAARELKKKYGDAVEFHVIGRLPRNAPVSEMDCLFSVPGIDGLSRERFAGLLRQMHYVCLPYQGAHYNLSASGVLLDAIAWRKPIIALPSPTVRELFALRSDIGYLCEDEAGFLSALDRVIGQFDQNFYRQQVTAVNCIRETRLPRTLSSVYRGFTTPFLEPAGVLKQTA